MEEYGITLGEICRIIFRRVWWVIGVTAAFLLITVLLVQFWYNPNNRQYTVSYNIRFPDSSSGLYPDGTPLRVTDSVLLGSLTEIKSGTYSEGEENAPDFSDIDIEDMVENDAISLTAVTTEASDSGEAGWSGYRLTVSSKYFKDSAQAVAFIKKIAEYPIDKAQYIVENALYNYNLTQYDVGTTYEAKIAALINQKNYVMSIYDFIKNNYGETYRPLGSSDKTISDYINEASLIFDSRIQSAYYNTVTANYYVWDTETYTLTATASIEATRIEIVNNKAVVAALEAKIAELDKNGTAFDQIEAYHEKIASYVERNAQLETSIKMTEDTLDKIKKYESDPQAVEDKAEFDAQLDSTRAQLATLTETAKSLRIATYQNESMVLYVNNVIETEGGINIIIAAVVGAVLGFIIVSVVILIKDMPEYKRRKYGDKIQSQTPETEE